MAKGNRERHMCDFWGGKGRGCFAILLACLLWLDFFLLDGLEPWEGHGREWEGLKGVVPSLTRRRGGRLEERAYSPYLLLAC